MPHNNRVTTSSAISGSSMWAKIGGGGGAEDAAASVREQMHGAASLVPPLLAALPSRQAVSETAKQAQELMELAKMRKQVCALSCEPPFPHSAPHVLTCLLAMHSETKQPWRHLPVCSGHPCSGSSAQRR